MDIYFWGTGDGCQKALYSFKGDKTDIKGFIDNDPEKWGKESAILEGRKIIPYENIKGQYDFIVVTVIEYEPVLYQMRNNYQDMERVICYFNRNEERISQWFDYALWRIDLLEERIKILEHCLEIRTRNAWYEIADRMQTDRYQFPIVKSGEEAVKRIVEEKCSLIRFGDGEFNIMSGAAGIVFQKRDKRLGERLKEVLQSEQENLLIAIANNYGKLDVYCEATADGIRTYMTDDVRAYHASVLKEGRVYYDAYMFKSYFPYKNREYTWKRVGRIKSIWDNRDVTLIEGEKTRTGAGNDLLDNAHSIKRILGPTQNAFERYDELLEMAKAKIKKEDLILLALGPAGKVLGYDLVNAGYQVVDVGQIDMDYEWYRIGIGRKVHISNKYVSQMPPAWVGELDDENYLQQIIGRVS